MSKKNTGRSAGAGNTPRLGRWTPEPRTAGRNAVARSRGRCDERTGRPRTV